MVEMAATSGAATFDTEAVKLRTTRHHTLESEVERVMTHHRHNSLQTGPDLLDAHPGDSPGDHQLLDLFGAFEDVVGPAEGSTPCRRVGWSVVFSASPSIRERLVSSRMTGF